MRAVGNLNLRVQGWQLNDAVAAVARASQAPRWSYAVTPNAAHFARLQGGDAALAAIYARADFCFLDSRVIALCLRLVGRRPPPVVAGADLVAALFAQVITGTTTICIVGGPGAGIARLPGRDQLGQIHHFQPSIGFWRDTAELGALAGKIADAGADYTFLCVGSPQQELLADEVARTGRARGVGICAGASIEFLTGRQNRAPRLVQRLALEWAWRLACEPRRLAHRYVVESPRGLWFVLREGGGLP